MAPAEPDRERLSAGVGMFVPASRTPAAGGVSLPHHVCECIDALVAVTDTHLALPQIEVILL
jgi:hypothetical protein